MAPSSITIKIDFGVEGAGSSGGSVAVSGDVPTPMASMSAAGAIAESVAVAPTPFDRASQMLGRADAGAPSPSSSLTPGDRAGSLSGMAGAADVPTPFSGGGFPFVSAGQASGAVPTPFDSQPFGNPLSGQAPTPLSGAEAGADPPPTPSQLPDATGKKGKK